MQSSPSSKSDEWSPRVSIITASYNKGPFIEKAIKSVITQNYANLEYIILDNCSTDRTIEVLDRYRNHPKIRVVVESDDGQSDAINKGILQSSGEIIGLINADDFYAEEAIARVVRYFVDNPGCQLVYGNGEIVDEKGVVVGLHRFVRPFDRGLLRKYDYVLQPSSFWRRDLWEKTGETDSKLCYVWDWEWYIRASENAEFEYLPEILSGTHVLETNKTQSGGWRRHREIREVLRAYGGRFQLEYARFQLLVWQGRIMEAQKYLPQSMRKTFSGLARIPYRAFSHFFHRKFFW